MPSRYSGTFSRIIRPYTVLKSGHEEGGVRETGCSEKRKTKNVWLGASVSALEKRKQTAVRNVPERTFSPKTKRRFFRSHELQEIVVRDAMRASRVKLAPALHSRAKQLHGEDKEGGTSCERSVARVKCLASAVNCSLPPPHACKHNANATQRNATQRNEETRTSIN